MSASQNPAPPCFDSQRLYELWYQAASFGGTRRIPKKSYCEDCTRKHQAAMQNAGRCTNITFIPET